MNIDIRLNVAHAELCVFKILNHTQKSNSQHASKYLIDNIRPEIEIILYKKN